MSRLTDSEWQVLQVLWDTGGAALGEVAEALRPQTGWSRNTVLTYLTRMEKKGLVAIDKEGYPHRYRAALDQDACRAQERRSFLQPAPMFVWFFFPLSPSPFQAQSVAKA